MVDEPDSTAALLLQYGRELAVIQTLLARLEKALFGNGQKGMLTLLSERMDKLEKDSISEQGALGQHHRDIESIVKLVAIVGGALGIWAHILGLGVEHVVKEVIK